VTAANVLHAPHSPTVGRSRHALLAPGWPLTLLFLGFPLWWVLGLADFVFLLAAVPMAVSLVRRRTIVTPRGFGIWLVFLAVVVVSAGVLAAQAPFAAEGDFGGRALTFGYRLAWYLAATVALLYVGNTGERDLPAERLSRLLAWMFVVTAAGGVLGVVAPHVEFRSALEMVLPGDLAANEFVHALVHPATADIQRVLGYAEARPRAPFAYSNSWGANLSFFLPFFLWSWCRRTSGWRRFAAPFVLAAAGLGVVYSLNRGVWIVLCVGAVYGIVQLLRIKGARALQGVLVAAVVVVVLAVLSPLPSIVAERFAHPHSNERRSELALTTVRSALTGSALIGFGNVRDVEGSFGSIAGGASTDCPACGVPPMGTQGQAWLVLFSQGLVGLVLFFGFFAVRLVRHLRSRNPVTMVGLAVLLFFLAESFVYDTLGAPFFTLMLALGLMWRADR
jgi:hypothetical protein